MNLCPCFLKQHYPQLISISLREAWFSIAVTWNMVIDNNGLSLSIFVHSNSIYALLVHLLGDKHPHDSLGVLGQHRDGTQEVTVTQGSLLDVGGLDVSEEDGNLSLIIVKTLNVFDFAPFV